VRDNAPNPALAIALRLRDQGHHVHYASSGEIRCISRHCHKETRAPATLKGLL
jgi:hypothetical protein